MIKKENVPVGFFVFFVVDKTTKQNKLYRIVP